MFTTVTYQDYQASQDKGALLLEAVDKYRCSGEFRRALDANCYFRGENPRVARKTILRARKVETRDAQGRRRFRAGTRDVVGNRIGSGFLFRLITQQNQFLLSEGVTLPEPVKKRLGADFDHQLELLGERSLLHGCAWGYWNADHLEVLEAARNVGSGFFPLLDERTGEIGLGVQFWQLHSDKPMYLRVFSGRGVTLMRRMGDHLDLLGEEEPYQRIRRQDVLDDTLTVGPGYDRPPLIPLLANSEGISELTPAIRSKIDAYDNILSDFADNLDRANDVYWVLNNFGGTTDDIAELLEEINRVKAVANLSDGTGSSATAEPHTIEVPYMARKTALDLLQKAIYQDFMGLDMDALIGRDLTNVAIRVAAANMNLKADRYEWQVRHFVHSLLRLLGCDTEDVLLKRQAIANESETVANIVAMRGDIDRQTALRLNPYVTDEEMQRLLSA